jgi:hypothetical protein
MRWAVFADPEAVVGKNVESLQMRNRPNPHRWPHIIGEHKKGRGVGNPRLRIGQAISNGAHRVLTHSEMNVFSTKTIVPDIATIFDVRLR